MSNSPDGKSSQKGIFIPDTEETNLKVLICDEIAAIARQKNLTQAKIADLVGLAQSDVSRIVNCNVKDYSIWRLMRILSSLGQNIVIEISHSTIDRGQIYIKSTIK